MYITKSTIILLISLNHSNNAYNFKNLIHHCIVLQCMHIFNGLKYLYDNSHNDADNTLNTSNTLNTLNISNTLNILNKYIVVNPHCRLPYCAATCKAVCWCKFSECTRSSVTVLFIRTYTWTLVIITGNMETISFLPVCFLRFLILLQHVKRYSFHYPQIVLQTHLLFV